MVCIHKVAPPPAAAQLQRLVNFALLFRRRYLQHVPTTNFDESLWRHTPTSRLVKELHDRALRSCQDVCGLRLISASSTSDLCSRLYLPANASSHSPAPTSHWLRTVRLVARYALRTSSPTTSRSARFLKASAWPRTSHPDQPTACDSGRILLVSNSPTCSSCTTWSAGSRCTLPTLAATCTIW